MAANMADLMNKLEFPSFLAAGHDRGGRVVQRLAQDFPDRIKRISILDIIR